MEGLDVIEGGVRQQLLEVGAPSAATLRGARLGGSQRPRAGPSLILLFFLFPCILPLYIAMVSRVRASFPTSTPPSPPSATCSPSFELVPCKSFAGDFHLKVK